MNNVTTTIRQARLWKREIETMSSKGRPKREGDVRELAQFLAKTPEFTVTEGICPFDVSNTERVEAIYEYLVGQSNVVLLP